MRVYGITVMCLVMFAQVRGQNHWNPDSTAYNYLSRGTKLHTTKRSARNVVCAEGGRW